MSAALGNRTFTKLAICEGVHTGIGVRYVGGWPMWVRKSGYVTLDCTKGLHFFSRFPSLIFNFYMKTLPAWNKTIEEFCRSLPLRDLKHEDFVCVLSRQDRIEHNCEEFLEQHSNFY